MALDRTWFNSLVDDDGSGSVGTIWNKAAVDSLMDAVDVLAETVPATLTTTGSVNDWAPGLQGHTLTRWSGAADLSISGLAGGVVGQQWTFLNQSATALALFNHNNAASASANRFRNVALAAYTAVAPGGAITYQYDGVAWYQIAFEQGAWITPVYNAANFTSNTGTWTVEAGDLSGNFSYRLSGRSVTVTWYIQSTSVSGSPGVLKIAIPGGLTASKASLHPVVHDDAGAGNAGTFALVGGTSIDIYKSYGSGGFANSTNATRVFGTITFEVN